MKIKNIISYSIITTALIAGLFFWIKKMQQDKVEFNQQNKKLLSKLKFVQSKGNPLKTLEKKCRSRKNFQAVWEGGKDINEKHALYLKWMEHQQSSTAFSEILKILDEYSDYCLRRIDKIDPKALLGWENSDQWTKALKADFKLDQAAGDWQAEGDFKCFFLKQKLAEIHDSSLEFLLDAISSKASCCFGAYGIEALGQNQAYKKNELIEFPLFAYDRCGFPNKLDLKYAFDSHYGHNNRPIYKFYPQKRGLDSVKVNIRQYDAFGNLERGHSDYIKFWVY